MSKKFFVGAHAKVIGHTRYEGYPIHDHMLVRVDDERVFQVHEVRGVMRDGAFKAGKPECENIAFCSSCEPVYQLTYHLNGETLPEEELITQYEVLELTDIIPIIKELRGKSPYFEIKEGIESFEGRQLDGRNKRDNAIIKAVKAAMNG